MNHEIPSDLRLKLRGKRPIFTITTGRSGTRYLARLLRYVPNVGSYHEPEPKFSDVMRKAQLDPRAAYEFWVLKKLPRIASEPAPVYIETCHLFCKGFVEPLLELGFIPDLIILSRSNRSVASSLYRLDIIPGRGEKGDKWLLSPEDPRVLPLPGWQALHDYQLCYWYCLEIEHRSQRYANMLGRMGARVVQVSLGQIRTTPGFNKLVNDLGLPKLGPIGRAKLLLDQKRRVNTKLSTKSKRGIPEIPGHRLDSLEKEVVNGIARAHAQGIHGRLN